MATKLKPVDVVVVGVGVTGAILAKELAEAGLKVVGIERGQTRDTYPDFQLPNAHDELKYQRRHELMQDLSPRRSPSATTRMRPRCRCATWARSSPAKV